MTRPEQTSPEFSRVFSTEELSRISGKLPFDAEAGPEERTALAALLGARSVRKFRLTGHIAPAGGAGWSLKAKLGATVVQACAVTLEDVVTRIDVPVQRLFVPGSGSDTGAEVVFDPEEADDIEVLGKEIDIGLVAVEATSLALPDYPRAPGSTLPPEASDGLESEEKPNPFAALQALKDKMPPS